ncbi:hypothetical protein CXG81DRAFT_17777 [Caulochytrium protostelioides]|uniref:Uncharacterized protein n=1 Tax=Caulochytrium protostelioides TaxID=1555241 RepID=A0A4P9XB25_9FUNG|nr:hypothetical protein CXG81DRAFT_17777 [Caulochytrium protostelioides]|eukprot:RKP02566.1 hypothetical protein CXG81DRAFT_17777 [Caulochytrium protostelioides]
MQRLALPGRHDAPKAFPSAAIPSAAGPPLIGGADAAASAVFRPAVGFAPATATTTTTTAAMWPVLATTAAPALTVRSRRRCASVSRSGGPIRPLQRMEDVLGAPAACGVTPPDTIALKDRRRQQTSLAMAIRRLIASLQTVAGFSEAEREALSAVFVQDLAARYSEMLRWASAARLDAAASKWLILRMLDHVAAIKDWLLARCRRHKQRMHARAVFHDAVNVERLAAYFATELHRRLVTRHLAAVALTELAHGVGTPLTDRLLGGARPAAVSKPPTATDAHLAQIAALCTTLGRATDDEDPDGPDDDDAVDDVDDVDDEADDGGGNNNDDEAGFRAASGAVSAATPAASEASSRMRRVLPSIEPPARASLRSPPCVQAATDPLRSSQSSRTSRSSRSSRPRRSNTMAAAAAAAAAATAVATTAVLAHAAVPAAMDHVRRVQSDLARLVADEGRAAMRLGRTLLRHGPANDSENDDSNHDDDGDEGNDSALHESDHDDDAAEESDLLSETSHGIARTPPPEHTPLLAIHAHRAGGGPEASRTAGTLARAPASTTTEETNGPLRYLPTSRVGQTDDAAEAAAYRRAAEPLSFRGQCYYQLYISDRLFFRPAPSMLQYRPFMGLVALQDEAFRMDTAEAPSSSSSSPTTGSAAAERPEEAAYVRQRDHRAQAAELYGEVSQSTNMDDAVLLALRYPDVFPAIPGTTPVTARMARVVHASGHGSALLLATAAGGGGGGGGGGGEAGTRASTPCGGLSVAQLAAAPPFDARGGVAAAAAAASARPTPTMQLLRGPAGGGLVASSGATAAALALPGGPASGVSNASLYPADSRSRSTLRVLGFGHRGLDSQPSMASSLRGLAARGSKKNGRAEAAPSLRDYLAYLRTVATDHVGPLLFAEARINEDRLRQDEEALQARLESDRRREDERAFQNEQAKAGKSRLHSNRGTWNTQVLDYFDQMNGAQTGDGGGGGGDSDSDNDNDGDEPGSEAGQSHRAHGGGGGLGSARTNRSETRDTQSALEHIWRQLRMSEDERTQMALKYGKNTFERHLPNALKLWKDVAEAIHAREAALKQTQAFELHASDPERFFRKGYEGSTRARLEEAKQRQVHLDALKRHEQRLAPLIRRLKLLFNDTVRYHGAVYEDKMAHDYGEMIRSINRIQRAREATWLAQLADAEIIAAAVAASEAAAPGTSADVATATTAAMTTMASDAGDVIKARPAAWGRAARPSRPSTPRSATATAMPATTTARHARARSVGPAAGAAPSSIALHASLERLLVLETVAVVVPSRAAPARAVTGTPAPMGAMGPPPAATAMATTAVVTRGRGRDRAAAAAWVRVRSQSVGTGLALTRAAPYLAGPVELAVRLQQQQQHS